MRALAALITTVAVGAYAAGAGATSDYEEVVTDHDRGMMDKTAEPAEAASPPPVPAEVVDSAAGEQTGAVARAMFTTGVANREPADVIEELSTATQRIYYFSEVTGMEGQTVTHRWERKGEILAEIPFQVRGPRWRVYSSKNLVPTWTGEWSVAIVDEAGRVLTRQSFEYVDAAVAQPSPVPEAPDSELPAAPQEEPEPLPAAPDEVDSAPIAKPEKPRKSLIQE